MPVPLDSPCVLQVLPALAAGGVERGTLEMAAALKAVGWRAIVASSGGPLVPALEALGATHVTLPLASKNPLTIWRNAAALEALILQERVAIIHARSRAPAWSAWLAARRTGAHFVTTYHGTYNEDLPFKRQYNAIMAQGERVIAISQFIARHIQERHGTDAQRIRIIPRGVDPTLFDPAAVTPERLAALRKQWQLPGDAKVVVLPARLTRWKGQAVLVEALARLPEKVVAVMVGAGRPKFRQELLDLAGKLGLADRVRLVGHVADMPAALMLADVVVHASTDPEAFGRAVIEGMAMARPVLAADLGAPPEVVRHGQNGWLVPPGFPEVLANAIGVVFALPEAERQLICERARATVLANFTTEAMQQATLDTYWDLLHQAAPAEAA
jgi:glycosyltransferase involved in cell wall biosynthesis